MAVDTFRPGPPPPPTDEFEPAPPSPSRVERLREFRPNGWMIGAFVVALTLGSLVLRTRQLNFYYWIDEAISVGISSHPLGQLHSLLRQDGSPPLYYVLLHFWMRAFGSGPVATHWLSLIFALITVPVAYWGGATLFGRRAGAFAATLAAGLPFLTSYAQETRMYSLLALLSLIVAASFVHVFVYHRRRYLPGFALSLAAALYTHNWALFLGLATFIAFLFCVWVEPLERRRLCRDGAIGFGAVAVMYLPWLPTLLYQAKHTGAPWALSPVVWSLTQAFYFLTGSRAAAVALLLAGGFGFVAVRAGGVRERRTQIAAIALAIIGLGTLLIAWAYAKHTPAWSGRYFGVLVGPLTVLFALGLARARGLGIFALVLVCCFWVLDPRPTSRVSKSNVAAVAHVVDPRIGPSTLVLSTQPEQVPALAYYMPHVRQFGSPLGRVPDPRVMDWRNALIKFEHSSIRTVLAPMVDSLTAGQRVMLIVPTTFQKSPEWMTLIHRTSRSWRHWLRRDPRLRLIATSAAGENHTSLGVEAMLFAVRRD
jgi:mannosyltransferase